MVSGSRSGVSTLGANCLLLSLSPCTSGERAAEGCGPWGPEWCRLEARNGRVCTVAVRHGQSTRVPREDREGAGTQPSAPETAIRNVPGPLVRPVKTHYLCGRLRGAT